MPRESPETVSPAHSEQPSLSERLGYFKADEDSAGSKMWQSDPILRPLASSEGLTAHAASEDNPCALPVNWVLTNEPLNALRMALHRNVHDVNSTVPEPTAEGSGSTPSPPPSPPAAASEPRWSSAAEFDKINRTLSSAGILATPGATALSVALAHGLWEATQLLLQAGASIHQAGCAGYTAHHLAVASGKVRFLDQYVTTVGWRSFLEARTEVGGVTPAMVACALGHFDLANWMLEETEEVEDVEVLSPSAAAAVEAAAKVERAKVSPSTAPINHPALAVSDDGESAAHFAARWRDTSSGNSASAALFLSTSLSMTRAAPASDTIRYVVEFAELAWEKENGIESRPQQGSDLDDEEDVQLLDDTNFTSALPPAMQAQAEKPVTLRSWWAMMRRMTSNRGVTPLHLAHPQVVISLIEDALGGPPPGSGTYDISATDAPQLVDALVADLDASGYCAMGSALKRDEGEVIGLALKTLRQPSLKTALLEQRHASSGRTLLHLAMLCNQTDASRHLVNNAGQVGSEAEVAKATAGPAFDGDDSIATEPLPQAVIALKGWLRGACAFVAVQDKDSQTTALHAAAASPQDTRGAVAVVVDSLTRGVARLAVECAPRAPAVDIAEFIEQQTATAVSRPVDVSHQGVLHACVHGGFGADVARLILGGAKATEYHISTLLVPPSTGPDARAVDDASPGPPARPQTAGGSASNTPMGRGTSPERRRRQHTLGPNDEPNAQETAPPTPDKSGKERARLAAAVPAVRRDLVTSSANAAVVPCPLLLAARYAPETLVIAFAETLEETQGGSARAWAEVKDPSSGNNVLHMAAAGAKLPTLRSLMQRAEDASHGDTTPGSVFGALIFARNASDQTPRDVAASQLPGDVVDELFELDE